jgi:iron complex outermembrane recepter protein
MMRSSVQYFAVLAAAAIAAPAQAQTAEAPVEEAPVEIGEIVVTAQRRSEALQDTPLSIIALTAQALEKRSIFDINDLRSVVPNVQITPFPTNAASPRIFIRGIGNNDNQVTTDPTVAVYMDGVYVARSQGLGAEVADLERIEVLRGPQGSLYGRNATGGAINYITKAPKFGEFSAKQTIMAGDYAQFRSRTNVNIPIGENLAVSLGYLHAEKEGFVRNLGTGVDRYGDQRRDAYRAAVRWAPLESLDVRYIYDRSDYADTPVFVAEVPLYPAERSRPLAGSPFEQDLRRNDNTSEGHNLTASWEVGDHTLKSITAYRKLSSLAHQSVLAGVLSPSPAIATNLQLDQDQFTQELQLLGSFADDRLEYILGGYYFDESAHTFDQARIIGAPRVDRYVDINNKAYAAFGQVTFRPQSVDGLYVTGGLRWSRDERQATLERITVPAGGPPVAATPGFGDRSFSNLAPTFIVGYNGAGGLNAYAKYAKGYKTGGYNLRASSVAAFNAGFGEETLDAYEVGLKSTWLDNRLLVNVALFRSDYKDIQTSVPADAVNPAIIDIFNAGRARIQGVELDVTARPTRDLTLNVNYGYLDNNYTKIVDGLGVDVTDNYVFVNSPRHSVITSVDWVVARTSFGELALFADYAFQSQKYTITNLPQYKVGSYGILNARLSLSEVPIGLAKDWQVSIFAKNITDTNYYVDTSPSLRPTAIYGDPRTVGMELSAEF